MSKDQILRAFLEQRLTEEAGEISEVFNRRFSQWEEELCRLHEDNERQQKLLEAVFNPADVPLLTCTKEGWSPSLDQSDHGPLHFKEELKELWNSEEDQGRMLRTLVKRRLLTVAEHINELFDRTIAEYKKEICRSTHKNKQQQKLLDAVFKPEVLLHREGCLMDVQQLAPNNRVSEGLVQENPESHPIKEEQEEVMIKLDDEAETPPTAILYQTEEDKVKPPRSPFTCSVCGAKFSQKSTLQDHHMARHSGVKPFTCSLCGKHFACRSYHKKHMRRHMQPSSYRSAEGCPTKHDCSKCGKTFCLPSGLKRHLKVHTGEKPFRCSVCERSFARKAHLFHHMLRHTGERPYSCAVCKRAFARKDSVKAHMNVHTRKKNMLKRMNSSDGVIRSRVGDVNALVHQYEDGGSEMKCTRKD